MLTTADNGVLEVNTERLHPSQAQLVNICFGSFQKLGGIAIKEQ
jgi:hypothetical protein